MVLRLKIDYFLSIEKWGVILKYLRYNIKGIIFKLKGLSDVEKD